MNKKCFFILIFSIPIFLFSQEKPVAFKDGEWLRFRMSYSNWFKAGNATLQVENAVLEGESVYHVTGKGWTTGMIKWFFRVNDNYQSYFDKQTNKPYLFKRKVYEGGYEIDREIKFDYQNKKAVVKDFRKQKTDSIPISNIQDMISAFYFLRSQDMSNIKVGDELQLNMFLDYEMFPFKLRFLKYEILETEFGKIKCYKFRPIVQAGRVFKEQESLTVWITADENKIPIKVKASLSVGSLVAELDAYKGLANSFKVIFD